MRLAAGLGILALTVGCDGNDASTPAPASSGAVASEWPAGTVLAIGAVPISAAEVDTIADALASAAPHRTARAHRRDALTGLVLARASLRQSYPQIRLDALRRAEERRAELTEPGYDDSWILEEVGGPRTLGLEVWAHATHAPLETWSEPIEGIGRFTLVKRLAYKGAAGAVQVQFLEIPFELEGSAEEPPPDLLQHLARHPLTVVDPGWEGIVPMQWQNLMRGDRP